MSNNIAAVNKKALTKQVKKIAKEAKLPTEFVGQALDIIPAIFDAYKQTLDTQIEIAEIQSKRDILIEDVKQRYSLYSELFENIFSERSDAIHKYFDVIDSGIKNHDNSLISQGMQQLSTVVTSSPFVEFSEFKKQLESGKPFEL